MKVVFHWFRRDLRLDDNTALSAACASGYPVLPVFIFDENILDELAADDPRVQFIYENLKKLDFELANSRSGILIRKGSPIEVWKQLLYEYDAAGIYTNRDYEPYAITRDRAIEELAAANDIVFQSFKDQVCFEPHEVLKPNGLPYTVYTPYKKAWYRALDEKGLAKPVELDRSGFFQFENTFPSLESIGFMESLIKVKPYQVDSLKDYNQTRDYPALDSTSHLSPHLRFGSVSIRKMVRQALTINETFLGELIWRSFFMQILYHFPKVVTNNFRSKYDGIRWRHNEGDLQAWKDGKTGYPLVDAGMRELNATGLMHNRVRMVTASFLCKHLLIDWREGEAYFAEKLLDYELSANNGNWQWVAGTGCDAAPYFRIFNPTEQLKKFDPELKYVREWIPEFDTQEYPAPIVDHKFARERALKAYKEGIERS